MSTRAPVFSVASLALPGARIPPLLMVTEPLAVPVPARVAALATVTALEEWVDPVTVRVPPETVVTPV